MAERSTTMLPVLAACAAGALAACDGGRATTGAPIAADAGEPFLAFSSTFQGFRGWPSFHSDGPPAGSYPPDVLGPRTQYINRLPPSGRTAFPVGTAIVEARESGERKIFAAVKRGGGYNPRGASGWEWFELREAPDGAVTLVWRGLGPPAGQTYGSASGASTCNECHANCPVNDSICSKQLRLASF